MSTPANPPAVPEDPSGALEPTAIATVPAGKGGLYKALLRKGAPGGGIAGVGHGVAARVTTTLDELLAEHDPEDVAALVARLNALLPEIDKAQRGIAGLEARGDAEVAALVRQAAEVREGMLAIQGELKDTDPKDLPALLTRFKTLRGDTARLRVEALKAEKKFVGEDGDGRAALVRARGEAEGKVLDAQVDLKRNEAGKVARLGEAEADAERARIDAAAQLERVRSDGRAAALVASVQAGTRELEQGLVVTAVGNETRHRADGITLVSDVRSQVRDAMLPGVVRGAQEAANRDHDAKMKWLNRLNGHTPMYGALIAQVVSAYLSTSGIKAMADGYGEANWVLPVGVAASLNLYMLYLTMTYHNHGWDFSLFPIARDKEGRWTVNKNLVNTVAYVATALGTATLGYAGASTEFVPSAVIGTAIEEPIATAREYVTDQTSVVGEKISAPTAQSVQAVIDSGAKMVDEALGRGDSHVYGFRDQSIVRLSQYRKDVKATVDTLTGLGACDGVEQVADAYEHTMDVLQAEKDRNPAFSDAGFVTVTATGNAYDIDLRAPATECASNHPDAPADLVKKVDAMLKSIVTDVKGGAVTDTAQLNKRVFEMNELMSKIQAATGNEAPVLHEFDPMLVESIRILLDNIGILLHGEAGEHVAAWPFILLAIATVIDQVGMFLAITSRGSKLGQEKLVNERVGELSTTGLDVVALEKKRGVLMNFLNNLGSGKKTK